MALTRIKTNAMAVAGILTACIPPAQAQENRLEAADRFLASNFKTFRSVDSELAWCMDPILEKRVIEELKRPDSFPYPYDSLSKHINIQTSPDGLLRTFSWDKRSGGTWHDMASFAQYKSDSGIVQCQRLDFGDEGGTGEPTDVAIYEIHRIPNGSEVYYLLLGWGTYGGGKHHSLARVFRIEGDTLALCDSAFQEQPYLVANANRADPIELEYDAATQTLSYNHYTFDENSGFYQQNAQRKKWAWKGNTFVEADP